MSRAAVYWLTGIPASGKTTIAGRLVAALKAEGSAVIWLDSDDLRTVLTPNPTYSDHERDQFYAAVRHIAARAVEGGCSVVISATAPRRAHRDPLREAVPAFVEIHVACSEAVARARDPKGLYRAAASGAAPNLPGVGASYEVPRAPEITVDGAEPVSEAQIERMLHLAWAN